MDIIKLKQNFKVLVDEYTNTMTKVQDESLKVHTSYKMQWLYMEARDLLSKITKNEWNSINAEFCHYIIRFMDTLLELCPNDYKIMHKDDKVNDMLKEEVVVIKRNKIGFNSGELQQVTIKENKTKHRIGFIIDESEYKP